MALSPILQLPPESPALARAAAEAILILHIGGGGVGLVSGAAAAVFRKGGRLHRIAGNVFFVSMVTMTGIAAVVAPFTSQPFNTVAGLFTLYLVVTAWATVRRKEGGVDRFEFIAPFIALSAIAGGAITAAADSSNAPPAIFVLIIGGLAITMDVKMILRGGISGEKRITRHLWRMSLALFIASVSFFLGQQKIMPPAMPGAPILFVPAFAPLGLMFYWLFRVRFTGGFRADAVTTVRGPSVARAGGRAPAARDGRAC